MSVDLEQVQEKFEQALSRLFRALGLEGKWRPGERNAPLSIGEKLIPNTNISVQNWRDCRAGFRVEVDGKSVYMELTAGRIISDTGRIGEATTMHVVVARIDEELCWRAGEDFPAFANKVSSALRQRASEL